MNLKEYISSGIIESYVLGIATEAERAEFEATCAQYPEVLEARRSFEDALEAQLLSDVIVPPTHLRSQVLEQFSQMGQGISQPTEELHSAPVRSMSAWKWIAAAALILMAGSIVWLLQTRKEIDSLAQNNAALEARLDSASRQLSNLQQDAGVMQDAGVKMAALKGTANAPSALATVYWDTTGANRNVYLMVNNMPQTPTNKQYQLWALLDGKPISLGVFDLQPAERHLLIRMQGVQAAQAFAITLEPRGGQANPTMESMYVMGTL